MELNTKKAAIMVTDIVGYSSMMTDDVHKALAMLEKNRLIHREAIRKFKGKFVKEIGDGTFSIYESSLDAIRCAMEIWKKCCKEASLQLRIGIHKGNVIIRYSEILGDGVNIASLIESSGLPGGIYLSEKAYDDVKNRRDIRVEFHSEREVSKCPNPLRIYSIPTERMQKRLLKEKSHQSDPLVEEA
jgi:class 3 adenylate cyclase